MQSLLFPSPGEKYKERLTPLELGGLKGDMREWTESSSREQAEPRHSPGQSSMTGNLLREKHIALCVQLCLLD